MPKYFELRLFNEVGDVIMYDKYETREAAGIAGDNWKLQNPKFRYEIEEKESSSWGR